MAEESDLERTEPASSRRLEQAREEGQVPRSREVGAFLVLMVAAGAFWMVGGWMMQRTSTIVSRGLMFDGELLRDPQVMVARLGDIALDALLAFTPLVMALIVAALLSPFFLGSWNVSFKAMTPDLGRLDPLKGMGRIVSWSGVLELVKGVAKATLIGSVAAGVLWAERGEIISLLSQTIDAGLASAGHLINFSFLLIVASMLLIVALDVPFQLWQYHNKLKMTKEEVRRESKEMEGNPEVKGRIRSMQREAARRRMMSAVPTADVIVTNPTHFAVALAYKNGMGAPKVLAKGMGEIALKIRTIGAESGVPLLEAPPLARSLYRHAELDQEIPSALYAAVAEVLAYIYQLARWREQGGNYPVPPRQIPVPQDMMVAEAANG
ncbi:flagellar biosynthesis protein FlhB [Propionivibrio sp.]|jgi:flagellar biosynthetic protein FlhB|uniref:flagellar biosynthesis protein FlhB n=1 Tax=Propionivibrio sp. TaxID=2212460 RepID=UPI00272E2132|nr:flagellar biosynthesis protein FlhB [Propionivibrio sp.]